jgi:hypothetical protein
MHDSTTPAAVLARAGCQDQHERAADAWWDPARQRALGVLRLRIAATYFPRGGAQHLDGFLAEGWPTWAAAERDEILAPDWLAKRNRRYVSLWVIVSYWSARDTFGKIGDSPHCFACGQEAPCQAGAPAVRWNGALGYLERAHLVDHWLGGLDGPQNLVPLCCPCHRKMPMFGVGDGPKAIEWVLGA